MSMTQFGHIVWPQGVPDLSGARRGVRMRGLIPTPFRILLPALILAVALALGLAACGERTRTTAARPPTGPADPAAALAAPVPEAAAAAAPRSPDRGSRRATPLFHGEPLWAENRHGGAEDNARYQFEHRGTDIGARSLEDYLTRVHAFFDHPPADAETATRASNGDRLVYSPGANLFGVQRQDGAHACSCAPGPVEPIGRMRSGRRRPPRRGSGRPARETDGDRHGYQSVLYGL